jgi:acyl dehydratase
LTEEVTPLFYEDIKLGESAVTSKVTIEESEMVKFAAGYDPVPIHMDPECAAKTRYGKLIAPGVMVFMLVWARYIKETDYAGEQLIAGRSTSMEWIKPVFAGDTVYGRVHVTSLEPRNPYNGNVEITIDVYNQNEELVLTDVTLAVVARRLKK